jgi:hypothetical protein
MLVLTAGKRIIIRAIRDTCANSPAYAYFLLLQYEEDEDLSLVLYWTN